jgi:hypothetical protein
MRGSFAPSTAASAALASLEDIASAAALISDCVPVRASVSYSIAFLPVDAPGTDDSCLDQGVFILQTDDAVNLAVLSVGGISRSKLEDTGCFAGERFNLEDEDISALIEAVTAGIWSDPFGADLTAVKVAYLRQVR